MAKRKDINSILIIGAGPIVIGQGCEFDYSGVQACKALKNEGIRVILINSNPATIMTDPDLAHTTYIEPITPEIITEIIRKERPDALLATMGGQTALNCTLSLLSKKILEKYGVKLIGISEQAIHKAENRELFKISMQKIDIETPKAAVAESVEAAMAILEKIGLPAVIRASFTLGGGGGGIANSLQDFESLCKQSLETSPIHQIIIEESLVGWKEFELEVIRDSKDNCIVVCTIENLDPMGIHTGDSITIAPSQTLTDKEYQYMRNAAFAIMREIEMENGGANVQFAVHPVTGRVVVIEMNPRVSRSSALASKATGYPIAKIAAKLAVGYTLDELKNDITHDRLSAAFEPTIDYIVTKIPKFNFDKFPSSNCQLTIQMKSVGEVMGIGSTFQESLQKALNSLEINTIELGSIEIKHLEDELKNAGPHRIFFVAEAFKRKLSLDFVFEKTKIDPWFLHQIKDLVSTEASLAKIPFESLNAKKLHNLKQKGFSDQLISKILNVSEESIRLLRHNLNIRPKFKRIDSCSAEFHSNTAYLYSTYEQVCESNPTMERKIIVIGSGPNRIGQGIEFDYCCVHAIFALKEAGYETIMINCNPETVSTDYDVADRLYFEPLNLEFVLEIIDLEKPEGVIVQMGGQTALKLIMGLQKANIRIIGTSPDSIDCAENRFRFSHLLKKLNLKQPENDAAYSIEEALIIARKIGYPLILRPSYVLGGRQMKIVYDEKNLKNYLLCFCASSDEFPLLLEQFLTNAKEIDVDAVADGHDVYIGGILEHVEMAGVHSGDSTCCIPPYSLSKNLQRQLCEQTIAIARALDIKGSINIQFAIKNDDIYIIEANPRASRTIPFVSKATKIALAKISVLCMINYSLKKQGIFKKTVPPFYSVKSPVFPFNRFIGEDPKLGPEMKSTGETMGIGKTFEEAFIKSITGIWPKKNNHYSVFVHVDHVYLPSIRKQCQELINLNFKILASPDTSAYLIKNQLESYSLEIKNIDIRNIDVAVVITEDPFIIEQTTVLRINCIKKNINYLATIEGFKLWLAFNNITYAYPIRSLQDIG